MNAFSRFQTYLNGSPITKMIDSIFDDNCFFSSHKAPCSSETSLPSLDIYEDNKNLHIEAELPGFKEENIQISIEDGNMLIEAKNEEIKEGGTKTYIKRERTNKTFSRRITLPSGIDESKIEATLSDGILKITIAKIESSSPKRITITKK